MAHYMCVVALIDANIRPPQKRKAGHRNILKSVAIWVTQNSSSGCHSGVKVNHSRHTKQLIWDGAFLTTLSWIKR